MRSATSCSLTRPRTVPHPTQSMLSGTPWWNSAVTSPTKSPAKNARIIHDYLGFGVRPCTGLGLECSPMHMHRCQSRLGVCVFGSILVVAELFFDPPTARCLYTHAHTAPPICTLKRWCKKQEYGLREPAFGHPVSQETRRRQHDVFAVEAGIFGASAAPAQQCNHQLQRRRSSGRGPAAADAQPGGLNATTRAPSAEALSRGLF